MGNANIMIVEDNRIVAEDLKNKLVRMNYTVSAIATSGKKALAAAASLPPDLVLMDIQLGAGMNGIDTAAQLRRDYQTPIIYLTAYADEDTIDRAKATEPYGYIVKPYDDKDLKSAIEIALYKQASERKLIESHQWLHTTLKSIGDGVIATDVDGKVVFINPLAARLTGWPEEDVVGRPMPEVFRIINEDDRREQEDPVARVLREGDVLGMAKDTLLVSRDGTEIPIADSGAPIRDDKGQIIGVVLVFRDQTRERQAQKALLQSEARLNEAQRVAKIGDFKLDIETGAFVLSDNMYRLLGYDPGEPIDDGRINP
ncbi:MAG: response regulator, partial [Desulfatitalea sp.]|nr:response regulator [Desulfatitalea sp.]NNJ99116.1 response regulator [Desulfatitalea sp.]